MLGTNAGDVNIFVRCFREVSSKYDVAILLEPQHIPNVMTNFGKIKLIPVKNISEECLFSYLGTHDHVHDILMPSGFDSVKLLSTISGRLTNVIQKVALPDTALIEELDDKLYFARYCTKHGMPHPITVAGTDFFGSSHTGRSFPVMLKHRFGAGKQGIRLVAKPEDLLDCLESRMAEDYIVQEYLPGNDFAFNGYCLNGSIISWSIQAFESFKILGRDRLRISTFEKNYDIHALSERLIRISDYSGPINIDFRYVPASDTYYFIEVNPRFWANTHYSMIDGINFVDVALSAENPSGNVKPLYSGKTWGEPAKTFILMILFLKFGLLRFLLSQSIMQLKIELLDRLDRFYSRYMISTLNTSDKQ